MREKAKNHQFEIHIRRDDMNPPYLQFFIDGEWDPDIYHLDDDESIKKAVEQAYLGVRFMSLIF